MTLDDAALADLGVLLDECKGVYDDPRGEFGLWMYGGQWTYIITGHNLQLFCIETSDYLFLTT